MNTHFEPMDRFHVQIEGTQRVRLGTAPPDEAWRRLPLRGEGGEMPDEVRNYFAARINELADFFDRTADDEYEIGCALQEMVAAMGDATGSVTWRAWWTPDAREIEPDSRLELSTYAPLTYAAGQNAPASSK